ncbi:MAG: hypothetical protein ACREXU_18780, partial [Gammaproteobacteria bacterium]
SDWRGELVREDKRWRNGAPPVGTVLPRAIQIAVAVRLRSPRDGANSANITWVRHIIDHLPPTAGFVRVNGSISSKAVSTAW